MATITASLERSLQNCSLNNTNNNNNNNNNQTTPTRRRRSGAPVGRTPSSSSSSSSSSSDSSDHHHHHHQSGWSTVNHNNNHGYNNNNIYNYNTTTNNNGGSSYNLGLVSQSNVSSSDDNSTFVDLNSHASLPYHWEQCLDLKTGEIYYINWSNGMKAKEDPRTTATGYNGDYYSEGKDEDEDEESNEYDSEGSSTESSPSNSSSNNYRLKTTLVGGSSESSRQQVKQDSVLVVAGCRSCLMYYMVPKHVVDCPKCCGQLLHFPANP